MKEDIQLEAHQLDGVKYLTENPSKRYLAGVQGTGKTYMALSAAKKLGYKFILIVSPINAIEDAWVQSVQKMYGIKPRLLPDYSMTPKWGIWVCPYSWVNNPVKKMKLLQHWDLVIFDEAHKLKNPEALVTKTFLGDLATSAKRPKPGCVRLAKAHWFLSGTPATQSGADYYVPFRYLFPHELKLKDSGLTMSYYTWKLKFCQQATGRGFYGVKSEGLLAAMIQRNFLRITKADAGIDGKPVFRVTELEVECDDPQLQEQFNRLMAIKKDDKFWTEYQNFASKQIDLPDLKDRSYEQLSPLVQLGVAKAKAALPHLKNLGKMEKVVIFCSHLAVYKYLMAHLGNQAVGIYGGVKSEDRGGICKAFQNQDNIRYFVGQLKAASEAITLTSARIMWLIETGYVPATVSQAIARIDRYGQKADTVDIYFPVANIPIDRRVTTMMLNKAEQLEKVMAGNKINVSISKRK